MFSIADFVATVGVQLIENHPCQPWRSPSPPALADARGWYQPTAAGPMLLFILDAGSWAPEQVAEAITQWRSWLEALRACDSVLIVVWPDFSEEAEAAAADQEGPWQVWLVDLEEGRLARNTPPETDRPFTRVAEDAIAAYMAGNRLKPADLEEQEEARLTGKMPFGAFLDSQKTPATFVVLAALAAVFVVAEVLGGSTDNKVLVRMGANYRPLVEQGEIWRLVTANFLHIGSVHLMVNGLSLFAVGPMLEKLFGTWKFLAIYVVAGVTGALASFLFNPDVPSAGASGAIFGLLGAMLIIGIHHQDAIPKHQKKSMRDLALLMLVINLSFGFISLAVNRFFGPVVPQLDNMAHLGGLVGGTAMAALVGPHPTLVGHPYVAWRQRALGIFPFIAALGLSIGTWYAASGQVPKVSLRGPTNDYSVVVPMTTLDFFQIERRFYLSADKMEHYVLIESAENPAPNTVGGRPPLNEATLDQFAGPLASQYVTPTERLADPPLVMQVGRNHYVQVVLATAAGQREEVYLTASRDRLYAIRTKGLTEHPWVRATLQQVLGSFVMPATGTVQ
jgi:membrane associated rhomboid family serine protease